MTNELAGKVALVTGASKGIGAGIAAAFGRAGAKVAVGYARDQEGAERVVGEIKAAGGSAITVQGDLAKSGDIEAKVARAVATFGPIDTLVNNAAVFDFKALSAMDEAHFHHIFAATPLEKRPGHPSDLSPVAIFLACRASAWMTGEILTVSGGQR